MAKSDVMIGKNLREARNHAQMTSDELAEAVGAQETDIVAYESGRVRVSTRLLMVMATVLQTPIAHLMRRRED